MSLSKIYILFILSSFTPLIYRLKYWIKKATVSFYRKNKTIFPSYIIMKTIKQFWLKFYQKFTPKSLKHTSRIRDANLNGRSQSVKSNCKKALTNLNMKQLPAETEPGQTHSTTAPSTTKFLYALFRSISQPHYHPTSPKCNKRKPFLIPNLTPTYFDWLLHIVLSTILLEGGYFSKVLESVVPFHPMISHLQLNS